MYHLSKKATLVVAAVVVPLLMAPVASASATPVAPSGVTSCDGPTSYHEFYNVSWSSVPTNVKSAYITGPGTISYNQTVTANASAALSASVSAEAGVVLARASTTLGTTLTVGRSWTDGFSYTLTVPSGQRRAMQLFQTSRQFNVTKYVRTYPCNYAPQYSGGYANAPLQSRQDEWKLVW